MLKRMPVVLLVLIALGAVIWLSKNNQVGKVATIPMDQEQTATGISRPPRDLSGETPAETNARESARHAAGEVQDARLQKLIDAVEAQEDKVEERRKVLSTIVRDKGIVYRGSDSAAGAGKPPQDARQLLQERFQTEQEKIQLESQIKSLLKYDDEQLMVYAAGLELPDNVVREIYPKFQQARREMEALRTSGLGGEHPSVKAKNDQLVEIERQIDEGVIDLRATLKAQFDLASEYTRRAQDAQDYVDAKRGFETDSELLQQMKLKLAEEKAKSGE